MPFQNKLILFPAPHGSFAFAAQGMSQSVAVAFVVPGVMVSAQSAHSETNVRWVYLKKIRSRSLSYEKYTYSILSRA